MERDKKARTIERRAFTKLYEKIVAELNKNPQDKDEIKANMSVFEKRNEELERLDKTILELMLDNDVEVIEFEQETTTVDEYARKYKKIEIDVQKVLKVVDTTFMHNGREEDAYSTHSERTLTSRRKFKLPEIELKKFDGSLKNWLHFWGQFRKIDEDEELAEEDKFQYLIQSTMEGSRAHDYVNSFPPSANNYKKAIKGLKNRFGREDLLVEVYVRELLTIVLKKVVNKNEILPLCSLYDKLECHLRALESLGVTSEKYAAMLFPLVESCMPEDLLRTWQRTSVVTEETSEETEIETTQTSTIGKRLKKLMLFLRSEVHNEERIKLATSGFSLASEQKERKKKLQYSNEKDVPTATSLVSLKEERNSNNCIFCGKKHNSSECFKAKRMSLEEKKKVVNEKKGCYFCLRTNHFARRCRVFIKCAICEGRHVVLMCPKLSMQQETSTEQTRTEEKKIREGDQIKSATSLANPSNNPEVFLQTLVVKLKGENGTCLARALIDTGSQKSYVLEDTAKKIECKCYGTELLIHSLFGGVETLKQEHKRYQICVSSLDDQYSCEIDVLSQPIIVNEISHVKEGVWMQELQKIGIKITDIGKIRGPIQILIGADVIGPLFTNRQKQLPCGLVALETRFGWTLMGKVPEEKRNFRRQCTVTSMLSTLTKDAKICDLWELDVLGIKDPIETKSKHEKDLEVQQHFLQRVRVNEEGRYEIKLPWISDKPKIPSNYEVAEKRLNSLTKKLKIENLFKDYDQVFKEWCNEGIIEVVDTADRNVGHYLPHRHVVKENSTTRIRPVFDASSKTKINLSLNECLEIGPNLMELIPSVLLRFRENKIGVIADIKRAFLQISISNDDREYLRFLWWDERGNIKVYRHARVVFGVTSSPFLLTAVIDYHLNKILNEIKDNDLIITKETVNKLRLSFYVDNCVTSVNNHKELEQFILESKIVMSRALFDLRGWEHTYDENKDSSDSNTAMVLGLLWNKCSDTLEINTNFLKTVNTELVTKRLILSVAHKLFDPIGFICPITVYPKLLLQETWKSSLGWDAEVDEVIKEKFLKWYRELQNLNQIKIPRWLFMNRSQKTNVSIHTFCDASKTAYAAAIFLREEDEHGINVRLIQAKSRIAPLKQMTIPRLELMAATVGARLTAEIMKKLDVPKSTTVTYWSDSTTVLLWIKRKEKWEIFVRNRVHEIQHLTRIEDWKHIPGEHNPADIISRGCSIRQLLEQRWWEGPLWLKSHPDEWPTSSITDNEEKIEKCATVINSTEDSSWYYKRFSNYQKIVRLIAWVKRFIHNLKCQEKDRMKTNLTSQEIKDADNQTIKLIQQEWFTEERIKNISSLNIFWDQEGIIRVRTKITLRKDTENFRFPIVLPDQHQVVKLLILDRHYKMKHAGVQILLNILREDYWITRGRRAVRNVIKGCLFCKRYDVQNTETSPCYLPLDRVRDARVFEVVGVDFAGPLHLKGNIKVWICLFTCAVYRAVHLEIVSSLSTPNFIQALRRFIARRGRPATVYSDNGTNFVGTVNLLSSVNWLKIEEFANVHRIEWKFNPPTAAWWGGWWERLIRIVKDLLKRVLGKTCVNYEEMLTLLIECESVINSRPITYLMDGDPSVSALSPNMFLHELREVGVPDLDSIDRENLNKRMRYLHKIRNDLRQRFRNEYLGSLAQKPNTVKNQSELKLGEIVLIGNDNKKRLDWPLAKIIKLIPGKDGECRVVELKTSKGTILRPVQRLYRLEICSASNNIQSVEPDCSDAHSDEEKQENEKQNASVTRSGRVTKLPKRYLD